MRIIRRSGLWQVLRVSGNEPVCLHRLALRSGYRVGEMAAELGCSGRYFHVVFVRDVGLSPKDWLCRERMVVARRMLAGGRREEDVSTRLGFSAVSSFRREFFSTHGISSARYSQRRRMASGSGAGGSHDLA
jgi:AraC-like DNA-binding protein